MNFVFELILRSITAIVLAFFNLLIKKIAEPFISPVKRWYNRIRKDQRSKLGYDGIKRRIDNRGCYVVIAASHFVLFISLVLVFQIIPISENTVVVFGLWAIFVLTPHIVGTVIYFDGWSPKDLEMYLEENELDKPKRKEKPSEPSVEG